MTISRIFYTTLAIGIIFGVAIITVANGMSGYITLTQALVTFYMLIVGCIGLLIPLIQKLIPVWKITLVSWITEDGVETVKAPK